ncbi:hypothetical protein QEV61_04575 [Trueperella pyogenes]|uniref:hypothetical protein n=1 Tax=Trueperella pyogenes TaxID=1661 RepID=UPI0032435E41
MNENDEYLQLIATRSRMEQALEVFTFHAAALDGIGYLRYSARLRQIAEEIHEDATLLREVTLRWCDRLAGEE